MRLDYSRAIGKLLFDDEEVSFTNVSKLLCFEDMCPSASCPFKKKGNLGCNNILATMVLTNKVKHVIMGD